MKTNKTKYALTLNGKPWSLLDNLEEARHVIGSACVHVLSNGQYAEGQYVGALVSIDPTGDTWSVCRVTPQHAGKIAKQVRARLDRLYAEHLARLAESNCAGSQCCGCPVCA